jgi:transposase
VLRQLGIASKRGREHVHSPDPEYVAKRQYIAALLEQVRQAPGRLVLLFGDEVTIARQPTLARAYEAVGRAVQPLARLSYRRNAGDRILGVLEATSGRVLTARLKQVTAPAFVAFLIELVRQYPAAERLYVVVDNWPVHVHPDVLCALEPQRAPFAYHRPAHWSTDPSARAVQEYGHLHLPVQLVLLPSYASWLNPIEKLWRKLRQEVLHLHRLADDDVARRQAVDAFFAQFAVGSADLLREVGLTPS